jgi:hypothetical protein
LGVALLAAWLGAGVAARAQAPVPEPLPFGPSPAATAGPPTPPYYGPLPSDAAPHGPPGGMVLSADLPGAFTDCPPTEETGVYLHLGGLGFQRIRPQHGSVAVIDTNNPTNLDTGARPLAERFLVNELDFHDLSPDMGAGVTATVGYLWGGNALELSGFYIFSHHSDTGISFPGRLDLPFTNPPLGFEGDNGMWLQADRVHLQLREEMGTAEFNYRYSNVGISSAELILGVRYTDLQETLGIFTDDDGLTIQDINGNPDPNRQALYRVAVHNRILAPQLGFEWHTNLCRYVDFTYMGKAAWGVDNAGIHSTLTRGDGLVGQDFSKYHTFFSHQYQGGFYLDFWLFERGRVRAGYNLLLMANVADAAGQVNYDLAHQGSQGIHTGTIFYHGPLVEFEMLF